MTTDINQGDKKHTIAILDLNEGQPNQGMRCIREILQNFGEEHHLNLTIKEFDVRAKNEIPDINEFDTYISSGGPGSPYDGEGKEWEERYFGLLEQIWNHNKKSKNKKYLFLICHSFQMACRYFKIADVVPRKSQAFGIFPIHLTPNGVADPVLKDLSDPFYGVDSRDWQAIQPNLNQIEKIGAKILAIEKERPHVPLERCIMAARFSPEIVGTQFHPEADAGGMHRYLLMEEKKQVIIKNHGEAKYEQMLQDVNDPAKLELTQTQIIPTFLEKALLSPVALACY
jgi:homoserine O-succinyltransferase